ncbi:MAG: hypothetical protein BWK77_02160 [Verrucomicrobia bacterium A1]|nr:MAG: hypothetical protein BWK77_02160 [Verrucomicrobia bacterium A1]
MGYIGPGAGFAFLGSFLVLLMAFGLLLVAIVSWPIRLLLWPLLRKGRRLKGAARRVVILGLDGLDPRHVRRLMALGKLPNFARLAERGSFSELATTCPPISPVAWSSFQTGVNPGKHNIFDFLARDRKTYLPKLSTSKVGEGGDIRLLRKSQPFWKVLGEHGVFSTVLRVPVTFPPERFYGLSLSALGVPDLRGSQGTSFLFTTAATERREQTGGIILPVRREGRVIEARLPGPLQPDGEMTLRFRVTVNDAARTADLRIGRERVRLREKEYSPWVRVKFGRIAGLCRFYLVSAAPEFKLYASPVHIDPERPAMPISHPAYYSIYLAKLLGPFATLGMAEDTWALNEGVVDERAFLDQVYAIHDEREGMFFEALRRTRRGLCVCVFDTPDRIQHMCPPRESADGPFEEMYVRMDGLLGRVLAELDDRTVLFVISDHGIRRFRRGVNVNAWLRQEGYLVEKPGAAEDGYLRAVDWTKTRAYALGFNGLYINVKGREAQGIVAPAGETQALKAELTRKLRDLKDPEDGARAILEIHDGNDVYRGPYRNEGPDLVIGYNDGYRGSWDGVIGGVRGPVFTDNTKAWSGDHCIDPSLVPGIFLCNRKAGRTDPGIMDLAPTTLALFGVPVPAYMDGKAIPLEPLK